jgi:histone-lysine N-methyltransferase SETMAR
MADMSKSRFKERAVIEFLTAEGEVPIVIHRRLTNVYGEDTVSVHTVRRWVTKLKSSDTSLADRPRSGRPATAVTDSNQQSVYELIRGNRRITQAELSHNVGIGHHAVESIINNLGYSKVCARWVPRMLTDVHKAERKRISSELLQQYEQPGDNFLSRIITGDESWVHYYEPETKRQSMEWRHDTSPRPKKFKTQASAGKVMVTVFWDIRGVVLVDFLAKGSTINSEQYISTLKKLKARIRQARPHMNMQEVLLQQDNARPHTSRLTSEAIAKMGWGVLPHPAYCPDLAPSDFHLFGPLKDALRGHHFQSDDDVKTAVRRWLHQQDEAFFRDGTASTLAQMCGT